MRYLPLSDADRQQMLGGVKSDAEAVQEAKPMVKPAPDEGGWFDDDKDIPF